MLRILCWRDASRCTLYSYALRGCISQYFRILYWRDASRCTLEAFVMEGCISQTLRYCVGGCIGGDLGL